MRAFFSSLMRNPLSLAGAAITTAAAIVIAALFALGLLGLLGSPYVGILAYLIVPGFFIFGLILIPIGVGLQRRRERRQAAAGVVKPAFPIIDFNRGRTQRVALIVFSLTFINLALLAVATYKGVELMDSTPFCGQTCHTVMKPEYTAYRLSPHARVACVDCHIGPGADWFVKSKLSGLWQVFAVTFNLYPRPIPVPIENLRPARETCEQCHWPEKFTGDKLQVNTTYADDEKNTKLQTVLLLKVGGIQGRRAKGIHWHIARDTEIRFRANEDRSVIYDVLLTQKDGTEKLFKMGNENHDDLPWITMDCLNCHNRPTHIFYSAPHAIDGAMLAGVLPTDLPYLHKEGVEIITKEYPSQDVAREKIRKALVNYYEKSDPDLAKSKHDEIVHAGDVLGDLYSDNVFPSMNVTWGTYPVFIGHPNFQGGCWRCHDDQHATASGEVISQDCSLCHDVLAQDEEHPEVLQQLKP